MQTASNRAARRGALVSSALLCLCLALIVAYVSSTLHPRFEHHLEIVHDQFSILSGSDYLVDGEPKFLPEFRNRVMFPALLAAVSHIKLFSPSQWFTILRIATLFLMFLTLFHVFFAVNNSWNIAAAGVGIFALAIFETFNHGWEHPTDAFDAMFFGLFCYTAVNNRFALLCVLAIVACFNRESATFSGVLWIACQAHRPGKIFWKQAIRGVTISCVCYGLVMAIRYAVIGPDLFRRLQTAAWRVNFSRESFRNPQPFMWPVLGACMAIPTALWIGRNRSYLEALHFRILGGAIAVALITVVFGLVAELRVFIPALVIFVYGAVQLASSAEAREAGTTTGG